MRFGSVAAFWLIFLIGAIPVAPSAHAENEDSSRYPSYNRPRDPSAAPQRRAAPRASDPYSGAYGHAQPEPRYVPSPQYGERPQPRYVPSPQYGARYQPGPFSYQPSPAPAPEGYSWPWEQRQAAPPAYARRYRDEEVIRDVPRRRVAPRPVPAIARQRPAVKPKPDPSTTIVVFGDTLADLVGEGIDDAFDENPDVTVTRKTRGDGGLARADLVDWPKVIQEYLTANPKTSLGVMMVGADDRQAIREGDVAIEPLSDRWREIYRDRVDAVLRVFAERKVPLVWIGAPPMKNEGLSTDMIALNDIYRERVQKAGNVYVDIWPGFVNDENRYAPAGPDVQGQVARLRANDGVHFTRAGARKAAHFADLEIKRLIEPKSAGTALAALPAQPGPGGAQPGTSPPAGNGSGPAAGAAAADIDRIINASLPALPEPAGLPSLPVRPLSGPVLPLTRPDISPGAALANGRPRPEGEGAANVERALRDGVPSSPRPGRADDFRWPKS